MFDKFLKYFKRDFWKMSDSDLVDLASRYNLLSEPELERITVDEVEGNLNPNYERNQLSQKNRKDIIQSLLLREKYVRDYLTLALSVLAIVISVISLIVSISA